MTAYKIPFNRPSLIGTELAAIARAVESGHISGDGAATKRCERLLAEALGAGACCSPRRARTHST